MSAIQCCLALSFLLPVISFSGTLSPSPLTVLMDFESPHSDASLKALSANLNLLLKPSGVSVDVEIRSNIQPGAEFRQLVVFKMKGSCLLNAPLPHPSLVGPGPLAMAYVTDGRVLHFGEVECDRVRRCVQQSVGYSSSSKNQRIYGSALAVVIAHELYHMLGNAKEHTHDGITKARLSASELVSKSLNLPPAAAARLDTGLNMASSLQ